jgi:zinc and cadmium transporter
VILKKNALVLNFIIAVTIIIGSIIGYFVLKIIEDATMFLLTFTAGGFIYIAATDLIPEIKKELNIKKSMATIVIFIIGILIMWLIKVFFGG